MHRFLNKYAAPIARRLPNFLRAPMKRLWDASLDAAMFRRRRLNSVEYEQRISNETTIFEHQEVVHDLPEIYHYWSNKYIRPILEQFGFSNPDEFFVTFLGRCI